jgi:acyl dehydratase
MQFDHYSEGGIGLKGLSDYQIGDELPSREWHPTKEQIKQYAEVVGDFNLIHLDEAFAREAGMGGIIAHGMMTMAQAGAMLTEWLKNEGSIENFEVRFENMVRPGDIIVCSGRIKEKKSDILKCDVLVTNNGQLRILSGSAVVKMNT